MIGSKLRRSLHIGLALGVVSVVARVGLGILSVEACASTLEACSVSVKSQTKYTASGPSTAASMGTYAGDIIRIFNQNGDVIVQGDPNATNVTVSTVPFAFADNQDDGSAAIADVETTIKIDQSQPGTISVNCSVAVQNHGSAANGTTGCGGFTVTVPAGTLQAPIPITAHAQNGSLTVSGLTMSDSQVGQMHSDVGDVQVSVNGSVKADAANGTVTAAVVPNKGSTVEASSGNGDVTLSLPRSFACDSLSLQASGPDATVNVASGFTNAFMATSTSVGTPGTGAGIVSVSTQNGSITLQPQG
jgi:hypothetical protein